MKLLLTTDHLGVREGSIRHVILLLSESPANQTSMETVSPNTNVYVIGAVDELNNDTSYVNAFDDVPVENLMFVDYNNTLMQTEEFLLQKICQGTTKSLII